MPVKVVDASALAALLFGEPEGERIGARLEGARLVAPALLSFEVSNVCLVKIRRHPGQRDALRVALAIVPRMGIETVEVDHGAALLVAEQARLTMYDAGYLWLAEALGAELVTLDRRLEAARAPGQAV